MQPAWWLCGIRAHQRKNGLCLHFFLGESCPLALTLMPDTSIHPYMPLVTFNLLQGWIPQGVNLSKFLCGAFQEEMPENPTFFFPTDSTLTGFYSQKLWGLIFLALNPELHGQVWSWDPSLLVYPSVLHPPDVCLRPSHSTSPPLQPSYPSR